MSDQLSFLKARYCRSVLRTAANSPLNDARHLVFCLSSECLTPNTARSVQLAEREALAAVLMLHERFGDRSVSAVAGEWKAAQDLIDRWIETATH